MAFEIKTGTFENANDLLDKFAKEWSFDSVDKSSTDHKAIWGDTGFIVNSTAGNISSMRSGAASGYYVSAASGNYKIIKAKNTAICIVNASEALIAARGKSIDDESNIIKIAGVQNANENFTLGLIVGSESILIPMKEKITLSTAAVQVIPYLYHNTGVAADNLYLNYISSAADMNTKLYINDELFYIFKGIAIREE